MNTRHAPLLALAACLSAAAAAAQVPGILSHQGRLAVNGTNFTGPGQFKFSLVNAAGDATYWSHDGAAAGGAEPAGPAVVLAVSRGVFAVNLGDLGVSNMLSAIPAEVFTNSAVYLRVWVSDGAAGFQQLAPDTRVVSAAYALAAGRVLGPVEDTQLSANVALRDARQTFTGPNVFSNAFNEFTGRFTGDGSGLTNLSASVMSVLSTNLTGPAGGSLAGSYPNPQIAPGAIVDAHISGSAAIAGSKIAAATTSARGTVALAADGQSASSLAVQASDSRLANNLKTTGGTLTGPLTNPSGFYGSGVGLTSLDASALTFGSVADARLTANVALRNVNQTFTGWNTFANVTRLTNPANILIGAHSGDGSGLTNLTARSLISPAPSATNFSGALAGDVTGTQAATVVAAVGGVAAANVATAATAANAAASAATPSAIVRRDASGNFAAGTITAAFAGNGAALTNLNASSLASGAVPDARLSANAALRDAHQTFTGSNAFTGVARLTNAANVLAGSFSGDGSGLSNLTARSLISPASSATNFSGALAGDVTGTQAATVVAAVGGVTAANVATAATAANAAASAATPSAIVRRDASGNFAAGTITAAFAGNGAALTNLNASSLASGAVPDARLSANAALRDAHQTFTGSNAFTGVARLTNAANVLAGTFTGDGSGLSNLTARSLISPASSATNFSGALAGDVTGTQAATVVAAVGGVTAANVATAATAANAAASAATPSAIVRRDASGNFAAGTITAAFAGNGAALTNLNATSLASGTVADARLSANAALRDAHQTFTGSNAFTGVARLTNAANLLAGTFTGDGSGLSNLTARSLISPASSATNFSGGLAGDVTGTQAATVVAAVGGVAAANVATAATAANAAASAATPSAIVRRDASGNFAAGTITAAFAGNGAALTNLNATSLASGTVADARLSANAALRDANQTFAGVNAFTNPANQFVGVFSGDGSGLTNLAGVIASNLSGALTGAAGGDLSGTYPNPAVASVGGVTAANVAAAATAANAAASAATPSAIVRRDASGNFAAGTITAAFAGNGAGLSNVTARFLTSPASSATNFTGDLAGDVSGTQAATVVTSVGSVSAASIAAGASAANAASSSASPSTIVRRDASGNFAAGTITATHAGNGAALTNLNASSLASGTLADARLSTNAALRDANQTFTGSNTFTGVARLTHADNLVAGTFWGDGAGLSNVAARFLLSPASSATNFTGTLAGDVTGSQAATVVAFVAGAPAADVAAGAAAASAASSTATPSAIVRRDASGNFAAGTVTAAFAGNGAALTNLNASSLASGTLADARLSANAALRDADQTFAGANTFSGVAHLTNAANVLAGTFSGNGAALTNLNASSLASGALADARLSVNIPRLNAPQEFTAANVFTNAGNRFVGTFTGDGTGLTNLAATVLAILSTNLTGPAGGDLTGNYPNPWVASVGGVTAANVATAANAANAADSAATPSTIVRRDASGNFAAATITAAFVGDGAALVNLNASSLASGTVPDARLSANAALRNANQAFSGSNTFSGPALLTNAANILAGTHLGDGAGLSNVTAASLISPAPSATNFSGALAGDVTGIQAATVVAAVGGVTAANVAAGATAANTATNTAAANTIVRRDASGNFAAATITGAFTGNGSGLTNVPAGFLTGVAPAAANFTGALAGDVTGTQGATAVASVGGVLASNVATGATAANAAAIANELGTIVRRDPCYGDFAAGTVTATRFVGDGSGLTNLPTSPSAYSAPAGALLVSLLAQDTALIASGYRVMMNTPAQSWVNGASSNALSARYGHTVVWDGQQMILWGGQVSGGSYSSAGGMYRPDTDTWTTITSVGAATARSGHTAVWSGSNMIVWGGSGSGNSYLGTGGKYSPASTAWSAVTTTGAPSGRNGHVAVWTGSQMLVWGGLNSGGLLNDGALYDPSANQWTALTIPNPPEERLGATAVWAGDRMIVWGGTGAGGELDTGAQLIFTNGQPLQWVAMALSNAPLPRIGHTAVWAGDKMVVWGGQYFGTPLDDGAAFCAHCDTWVPLSTTNAPSPRYDHAAVWTGTEMLIAGGANSGGELSSAAAYDLTAGQWRPLSTTGNPLARTKPAAVWSGTEILLFGGQSGGQAAGSLQRLSPQPTWYFYRKL